MGETMCKCEKWANVQMNNLEVWKCGSVELWKCGDDGACVSSFAHFHICKIAHCLSHLHIASAAPGAAEAHLYFAISRRWEAKLYSISSLLLTTTIRSLLYDSTKRR